MSKGSNLRIKKPKKIELVVKPRKTKRLKNEIKKYHRWCSIQGYPAKDNRSLLWYFNQKSMIRRVQDGHQVILFGKGYNFSDLEELFIYL